MDTTSLRDVSFYTPAALSPLLRFFRAISIAWKVTDELHLYHLFSRSFCVVGVLISVLIAVSQFILIFIRIQPLSILRQFQKHYRTRKLNGNNHKENVQALKFHACRRSGRLWIGRPSLARVWRVRLVCLGNLSVYIFPIGKFPN